jgi:hypothetical protein
MEKRRNLTINLYTQSKRPNLHELTAITKISRIIGEKRPFHFLGTTRFLQYPHEYCLMKRNLKDALLLITGAYNKHLIEPTFVNNFSPTLRDDVRISCITGLPATPAL